MISRKRETKKTVHDYDVLESLEINSKLVVKPGMLVKLNPSAPRKKDGWSARIMEIRAPHDNSGVYVVFYGGKGFPKGAKYGFFSADPARINKEIRIS